MKRYFYTILISLIGLNSIAQNVDKSSELNGITLGVNQSVFEGDIYLITGNEPAYKEAPSLQYSLKKKISAGVRDASYNGSDFKKFGNFQASNITMQFFEGKLYKVQWTFRNDSDLEATYNYLVNTYADKFGTSKEEFFDDFMQVEWQGRKRYAQVFMDKESDVTLVFEDVKTAKKVMKALSRSN